MTGPTLPEELERVVRAVPGVGRLYASAPAIADAATIARELVGGTGPGRPPRVKVADGVVAVVISTEHDVPAPQVARAVHDAVEAFMVGRGLALVRVEVRIAQVD